MIPRKLLVARQSPTFGQNVLHAFALSMRIPNLRPLLMNHYHHYLHGEMCFRQRDSIVFRLRKISVCVCFFFLDKIKR